jgi:hypothetical protein
MTVLAVPAKLVILTWRGFTAIGTAQANTMALLVAIDLSEVDIRDA